MGLDKPVHLHDVLQGHLVVAGKSTMHNHDLLANAGDDGEGAKGLLEDLIHGLTILGLDLTLESVHLVHVVCLVVASGQVHVVWVQNLEGQQRKDNLHRERAPVHKVSIEQLGTRKGASAAAKKKKERKKVKNNTHKDLSRKDIR